MNRWQDPAAHALVDPWPGFLDDLDQAPHRAAEAFSRFALKLLAVAPPRVLAALPKEEREDLVQELVVHFLEDDFRVLRLYRRQNHSFAAWVAMVARNRTLDHLRRRQRAEQRTGIDDPVRALEEAPDPAAAIDDRLGDEQVLARVRACMEQLDPNCRLLVEGASRGLKPRELTRVMGWPSDWNKKASDDLRACRARLKKLLVDAGVWPGTDGSSPARRTP